MGSAAPPSPASGAQHVEAPSAAQATAPIATPAPEAKSLADVEKQFVVDLVAAFGAHDAKRVAALYAADGVLATPGPDGWEERKGVAAIEKAHAELFAAFPDLALAVPHAYANGNAVAIEWVTHGTNTGPFAGGPPTNKAVGFRAASVLTFDDAGKVALDHSYMDDMTIAIQLGKAPGKARPMPEVTATETVWTTATGTPEEAALPAIAKANWPELWSKKDKAGYAKAFTEDAVHQEIASPNDFAGRKALMAELDMYASSLPDMEITTDHVFAAGDFALIEFTLSATQRGPIGPIKATNKRMSIHGFDVDRFVGDRYSSAASYSNAREFLTQLGVVPPRPPGKS